MNEQPEPLEPDQVIHDKIDKARKALEELRDAAPDDCPVSILLAGPEAQHLIPRPGSPAPGQWRLVPERAGNQTRVHVQKRAFLAALEAVGGVRAASRACGTHWRLHYRWIQDDPGYAAAVEVSRRLRVDVLEQELWERATVGYEEPVYQRGELVGTKTVKDTTALIFALKGLDPKTYKDFAPGPGNQMVITVEVPDRA